MIYKYLNSFRKYLIQIRQNITIFNILAAFLCICVIYMSGNYIHVQSYRWQCTTVGMVVAPVTRESCNIETTVSLQQKVTIGILMMYDNNKNGDWGPELMGRVLDNRSAYCKLHGYKMINANDLIDKSRPPAWSKLITMEKHLSTNQYDYLMYIDMDVVIMNPTIRLETFISPQSDFVMTTDWNGLNTGIWIAKNTEWTKWFLRTAWDQSQLVGKKSPEGISYPFEYEQRAFHFLTDSAIWQQRKLPKYRGKESPSQIYSHFHVLPQCAFNSYSLHPMDYRGDREVSQYVPGDFLIHFAGKKGQAKTDLMTYYLNKAERHEQ